MWYKNRRAKWRKRERHVQKAFQPASTVSSAFVLQLVNMSLGSKFNLQQWRSLDLTILSESTYSNNVDYKVSNERQWKRKRKNHTWEFICDIKHFSWQKRRQRRSISRIQNPGPKLHHLQGLVMASSQLSRTISSFDLLPTPPIQKRRHN